MKKFWPKKCTKYILAHGTVCQKAVTGGMPKKQIGAKRQANNGEFVSMVFQKRPANPMRAVIAKLPQKAADGAE